MLLAIVSVGLGFTFAPVEQASTTDDEITQTQLDNFCTGWFNDSDWLWSDSLNRCFDVEAE